jgi:hypothetical protein
LEEDRKSENLPLLQIINFGEIIYITKKDFGEHAKLRVIRNVIQMGFRIISATDKLVYEAAEIKGALAHQSVLPSCPISLRDEIDRPFFAVNRGVCHTLQIPILFLRPLRFLRLPNPNLLLCDLCALCG